jgi:protein phosphatase 1 regulatory subunit 12A
MLADSDAWCVLLQKMEQLKADNQRLKDENGALIRVISKLSK